MHLGGSPGPGVQCKGPRVADMDLVGRRTPRRLRGQGSLRSWGLREERLRQAGYVG